jgi:hypothetical protein
MFFRYLFVVRMHALVAEAIPNLLQPHVEEVPHEHRLEYSWLINARAFFDHFYRRFGVRIDKVWD